MEVSSLIGGIIGGAIGGSAFATFLVHSAINTAKDRWMESVKAQYATELEKVKDLLQRDQKNLQARLDQGTHVTQAQYDLELSSYRDLWTALSELGERWKSFFIQWDFRVEGQDTEFAAALNQAAAALGAAHDAAVLVVERQAPFYEKEIQTVGRSATLLSHMFLLILKKWDSLPTQPTQEEVRAKLMEILTTIEQIDGLIRRRLTSLRLI